MSIKYKAFFGGILLSLAAAVPVSAAPTADIEKDYSKGEIYVNVNGEENERFSVMILKGTLKTEELLIRIADENISKNDNITVYNPQELMGYGGECVVDNELVIEMKASGEYTVHITSALTGEMASYPVTISSKEDYALAIKKLNSTINNKDEFYGVILENKDILGFDMLLADGQDLKDISELLFSEVDGKAFDASQYEENTLLYNICVVTDALNNGKAISDTDSVIEELIKDDTVLSAYYTKHITTDERKTFLIEKLKNKSIGSLDELKGMVRDALILTVVKYPDGYMNIKPVFESYQNKMGIDEVTEKTTVYSKLAGMGFANIEKLVEKYEALCDSDSSTGSSGGSNGGGGGTGSGGGGGSISNVGNFGKNEVAVINRPSETIETVYMPFTDLDTVEWAYEAISTLADAGIVSGKSETKFAPRDNVKREEFVKMLVGAIGEEKLSTNGVFSDVSEIDWFDGFVGKAYSMNIVGGIGGGEFGTGMNISRQDMAVMVYKALLAKDVELENAKLTFVDASTVEDYAKEAVAVLANAGIINGQGDNIFNPLGEATRAEAAQMIYGIYKILK